MGSVKAVLKISGCIQFWGVRVASSVTQKKKRSTTEWGK